MLTVVRDVVVGGGCFGPYAQVLTGGWDQSQYNYYAEKMEADGIINSTAVNPATIIRAQNQEYSVEAGFIASVEGWYDFCHSLGLGWGALPLPSEAAPVLLLPLPVSSLCLRRPLASFGVRSQQATPRLQAQDRYHVGPVFSLRK